PPGVHKVLAPRDAGSTGYRGTMGSDCAVDKVQHFDEMRTGQPNLMGLLQKKRAFSLIEILVVVAILAVTSTIGLYSYSSYREALVVDTSAQTLQRILMQARNAAIHKALPH